MVADLVDFCMDILTLIRVLPTFAVHLRPTLFKFSLELHKHNNFLKVWVTPMVRRCISECVLLNLFVQCTRRRSSWQTSTGTHRVVNCLSDKAEHLRRDRHLSWFHIVKKHGDSDEKDEAMCLMSGDEQYTSSM